MCDHGSGTFAMQYLTAKQVADKLGIAVRTVWQWSSDGVRLPKPIYLGTRSPRWNLGTIELHVERLSRKRAPKGKR